MDSKANRLEIYSYSPDGGLTLVHSRSVYGYIEILDAIRPASSATDHLFVCTDRRQYFTCSWDAEAKQLKTEQSYVDLADKTLRSTRDNRAHIDPTRQYMTLELYDGIVTIIPFVQPSAKKIRRESSAAISNVPGTLGEPVQVRVQEIAIRDSAFLEADSESKAHPQLALLWEDNANEPHLKLLELSYSAAGAGTESQATADLATVKELRGHELDSGTSHLIPVPQPYGGFLVLGERSITYVDSDLATVVPKPLDEQATIWSCWTKVEDQRWLLADEYGYLYFLMLEIRNGLEVTGWKLDKLGKASTAACLVYLGEGLVLIGSHSGDSQVVQIQEGGTGIVQTFSNIAPILDLQLMDLGRGAESAVQTGEFSTGQARLVTASGAWQDGTVRAVRSGVGMEELGDVGEIPLITDMWGLSTSGNEDVHDMLLASFATETRAFKFDAEGSVEEVDDFCNVEFTEPTLLATNLPDRKLLQVHETGLRIADLESGMGIFQWKPADSTASITGACANGAHVIVVESGRTIHVFHTTGQDNSPSASKTFPTDSQISDVTISQSQSNACIVSFSQSASVAVLDLHSLDVLSTQTLGIPGTDVPRSILIANILPNAAPTLFISMADGTVVTLSYDIVNSTFSGVTRILLGSEPVFLKDLPRTTKNGQKVVNVFASCEQPSLIYASEGRIIYSAINSDQAARVCPFDSEAFPGSIAVASPTELKLAMIDTTRTTQLQTLPIGETVRVLSYQPKLKMFGIGCIRRRLEFGEDNEPLEELQASVSLADEVTFKKIDSFDLDERELVDCITTYERLDHDSDHVEMDDEESIFVVGTSINPESGAINQEDRGRILVFSVNSRNPKLNLLTQLSVRGACRSLAIANGMIVAGLVKVVALYSLAPSQDKGSRYSHKLTRLASYRTSTDPISLSVYPGTQDRPTTIAVGDLMKSVSIVSIVTPTEAEDEKYHLYETARHFATVWTHSVAAVGENEWAVADSEGNIAMLRQNLDAYGDEARRLEVTGEMRLGELINRIIPISPSGLTAPQQKNQGPPNKGKARTGSTAAVSTHRASVTAASLEDAGPLVRPHAFIATVEGSIYMLGVINPAYTDPLIRLQTALSTRVLAPGYMPWAKYRAWRAEEREGEEPFRFVDGEMVEQGLLNLSDNTLEEVLRECGFGAQPDGADSGLTVAQVRKWGEDLRRLY